MKTFSYDAVGSTNTVARELLEHGVTAPFWVTATRQSAGRGRLDRQWESAPGNVYATAVVARPEGPTSAMAFVSALAVADSLQAFVEQHSLALKWPNDVLMNGRKVAGILCETMDEAVLCGIGLNVGHHPEATRWPATHLQAMRSDATVQQVLDSLEDCLGNALVNMRDHGWGAMRARWLGHAHGVGTDVVVDLGSHKVGGRFTGLGPNGEMLLSTPSGVRSIVAGDVTYRT